MNHILYIMKVKKKKLATARENMRLVTYFDFLVLWKNSSPRADGLVS